ncbi:serine/threonine-protein kinase D3 isoform X2 [Salmo salar]|uniref:protein kinase C n=1 Tax=Salmo salar TaxID=8030 RepID=A0ABM3DCB3_SALSA|nr:serine/threonine-protein kinase D3-like isoform X2 [Salmo salar]
MDSGISSSLSSMSMTPSSPGTPGRPPHTAAPGPLQAPLGTALVQFQLGLFREVVRVSGGQLSYCHAKRLAAEIIERKAPDCNVVGVGEKVLLFRHQTGLEHLLHRLTDQDALLDGDLIEIILSGSATVTEIKIRPHSLAVQSYRTPTFCHHCGEMLWGLVRQGLKCEGCGLDFHKRCALQLPSDCRRARRRVCGPSLSLFPPARPRTHSLSTPAGGSMEEISMSKPRPRPPSWADQPVWLGVVQGTGGVAGRARVPHTFHIHSYTKPTVCQHCYHLLKGLFRQGLQCSDCKLNCHRRCESSLVPADCPGVRTNTNGEGDSVSSLGYNDDTEEEDMRCSMTSLEDHDDEPSTEDPFAEIKEVGHQPPITPCFSSYIPLMRVVQSVRHTKRRASGVLREGWLLHHTNTDTLRKRHYWILDWKNITLYQNETSTKYYKELPLSNVLQVRGPAQLSGPLLPDNSVHSFEVVTGTLVYCVLAGRDGQAWETAVRQALMPVLSSGQTGRQDHGPQSGEKPDVSSVYQIFTDEVLGSGQFGVVYRGTHRQSGHPVAIKVIDKTRFPTKQERQLRNEQAILQILEALRYLHFKHIAHCDLKPENVLVASPDPFPQVKLCDFGFARIIGEKSFRRSVVGTPAYLAPEVISIHGYNRSLDMWAVGVVLYVSLSGTFPFNEDEDISQQITNAAFMFPRLLWSNISLEAVSLINNLLQVSVRRRFSVGKALGHPWLQDFQLWCDLREFEQRMGCQYLTHEGDEDHWRLHAQERGLLFPSHLPWTPGHDNSL